MIITMHASSMDPRNGSHTFASPEHVICQAVARDMAEYYHIPTFGRAGTSDSKLFDEQAAFEAGYELLMQGLSGENLIHDVGYIESGLTASWDAMVMCNEYIGAVKRVVSGFDLSKQTFSLDLIDKIGPEGHFMAEAHTVAHFRREFWIPELFDRSNYHEWDNHGRKSLSVRAREEVKRILKTHTPEPLALDLERELQTVAARERGK